MFEITFSSDIPTTSQLFAKTKLNNILLCKKIESLNERDFENIKNNLKDLSKNEYKKYIKNAFLITLIAITIFFLCLSIPYATFALCSFLKFPHLIQVVSTLSSGLLITLFLKNYYTNNKEVIRNNLISFKNNSLALDQIVEQIKNSKEIKIILPEDQKTIGSNNLEPKSTGKQNLNLLEKQETKLPEKQQIPLSEKKPSLPEKPLEPSSEELTTPLDEEQKKTILELLNNLNTYFPNLFKITNFSQTIVNTSFSKKNFPQVLIFFFSDNKALKIINTILDNWVTRKYITWGLGVLFAIPKANEELKKNLPFVAKKLNLEEQKIKTLIEEKKWDEIFKLII